MALMDHPYPYLEAETPSCRIIELLASTHPERSAKAPEPSFLRGAIACERLCAGFGV